MSYAAGPEAMGSWLSDGLGWVADHIRGGGGNPAFTATGYRPPTGATPVMYAEGVTDDDLTDLEKIRVWTDAVRDAGAVPTRMPSGMDHAGELAARATGPGTSVPNGPSPFVYVLAPQVILEADHRIRGKLADEVDAYVPPTIPDPNDFTEQLKKYGLWAALGIGAVLIVPPLLRRSNPRGRRRRR